MHDPLATVPIPTIQARTTGWVSTHGDVDDFIQRNEDFAHCVGLGLCLYSSQMTTSPPPSQPSPNPFEEEVKYQLKPNTATLFPGHPAQLKEKEALSETPFRMASNPTNKTVLRQVKKHLVHLQDMLKAHAIVMVRSVAIEVHKKGIPLVQAFVVRCAL
ncbi:hypothetical protein NDA18_005128 [Ustilago nuda]|nr:hypothetical protein NDA18_005128 [Ustilago nuda]